jgi:pyridoxal phosphate enzyme (YggS family)
VVEEAVRTRLRENILEIRLRIAAASERAGRAGETPYVRLMAVTKTISRDLVEAAAAEGIDLFGENRVLEAGEKYSGLNGEYSLHLIGHLQRNKARDAAALFHCVQSVDKVETAEALSRQCSLMGRQMDILLEMNTSGEETKSGVRTRDELLSCLDAVLRLPGLKIRGLMTVGPLTGDQKLVRRAFSTLSGLFQELAGQRLPSFDTLSMGMSGDFETAIEEGSTLVRIGTAIFDPRS